MDDPEQYRSYDEGMLNLKIAADQLGLCYQPDWLHRLEREWDNPVESLVSFDQAPSGKIDNGHWFYLNSGFTRIGNLLYPQYYTPTDLSDPDPQSIRDLLLIALADRATDIVDEEGGRISSDNVEPYFYDVSKVLEIENYLFSQEEVERALESLDAEDLIERKKDGGRDFAAITAWGAQKAEGIAGRYFDTEDIHSVRPGGNLFFSVDASHISRLGVELVAKQETAVAELVKNGYDADATNVDLIFSNAEEVGGTLEIQDNGSGMSREELVNGFMRLSTNLKVEAPTSAKFNRQRAGRKGIGRFAAQRLGNSLIITTAKEDSSFAHQVTIHWDDFTANRDLSQVAAKITRVPKPFTHGTRLSIIGLRDNWTDAQIERSYRHIAELIQPFPLSETSKEKSARDDPGFKATFVREEDNDIRTIADDWTQYFQHALAEIEGWVDADGKGFWKVSSKKYKLSSELTPIGPDRENPEQPYQNLKNVHFKAFYYIDKEIARNSKAKIRSKLEEDGGIRLYRNGFRVLPYGARYDDWLKLNASNLLRKILPPHSNRNFLGFVEIDDVQGKQFEETAGREGLVENDSFSELKAFIAAALKSALMPVAEARDKRKTTTETRRERRTPKGQADHIIERLANLKKEAEANSEYAVALESVVQEISNSIISLGDEGEALLQELGMMRVLASLGLAIGEFTHEIGLSFEALTLEARALKEKVEAKRYDEINATDILGQIDRFRSYIEFFDTTVRDNVDREIRPIEIRDAINAFVKFLRPRIDRNEIDFDTDIKGFGLFTKPMHASEWSSVLVNLFTNSLKAIRRKRVQGRILIQAGKEDGNIYLVFSDNGDGIAEDARPKVFNAFFTTTSQSSGMDEYGDQESLAGMGLGLKIVRDLLETSGGEISLVDPPTGYSTSFKIVVPEATDEEIPDDAY